MSNHSQWRPQQPQTPIQVDLGKQEKIACDCGCELFDAANRLYRLPALLAPTGQESIANVAVLICRDCGEEFKVEKKLAQS